MKNDTEMSLNAQQLFYFIIIQRPLVKSPEPAEFYTKHELLSALLGSNLKRFIHGRKPADNKRALRRKISVERDPIHII